MFEGCADRKQCGAAEGGGVVDGEGGNTGETICDRNASAVTKNMPNSCALGLFCSYRSVGKDNNNNNNNDYDNGNDRTMEAYEKKKKNQDDGDDKDSYNDDDDDDGDDDDDADNDDDDDDDDVDDYAFIAVAPLK